MKPFTIILPIKGTDEEFKFMEKSIPSAVKINPDQILFGLDYPLKSDIVTKIDQLMKKCNYSNYLVIPVKNDGSWNFQLANIIWNLYRLSKNDIILSFDIDSILRNEVMLGLDKIGENKTALISFTKKLLMKSIGGLIRYSSYRLRVRTTDYVFSGVYWIYRPYFFDLVILSKYKKIINGVDTYLCKRILSKDNDYTMITRKEKGVNAMSPQNEDLDWRQFQDGVWLGANEKNWLKIRKEKHEKQHRILMKSNTTKSKFKLFIDRNKVKLFNNHPRFFVFVMAFMYNRWKIMSGYSWAKNNLISEAVLTAKKTDRDDWGFNGNRFFRDMKFKDRGTGYD